MKLKNPNVYMFYFSNRYNVYIYLKKEDAIQYEI